MRVKSGIFFPKDGVAAPAGGVLCCSCVACIVLLCRTWCLIAHNARYYVESKMLRVVCLCTKIRPQWINRAAHAFPALHRVFMEYTCSPTTEATHSPAASQLHSPAASQPHSLTAEAAGRDSPPPPPAAQQGHLSSSRNSSPSHRGPLPAAAAAAAVREMRSGGWGRRRACVRGTASRRPARPGSGSNTVSGT